MLYPRSYNKNTKSPCLEKYFEFFPEEMRKMLSDASDFWNYFYESLIKYREKEDHAKIVDICSISDYVIPVFPIIKDKDLLRNIVLLLYDIITGYYLTNSTVVLSSLISLKKILINNKKIETLLVDWKNLYKLFKYFGKNGNFLDDTSIMLNTLCKTSKKLSFYFAEDALTEILSKLLPKMSPHSPDSSFFYRVFSYIVPTRKNERIETLVPTFLSLVFESKNINQIMYMGEFLPNMFLQNPDCDYGPFVEYVSLYTSHIFLSETMPSFLQPVSHNIYPDYTIPSVNLLASNFSRCFLGLIISPKSRINATKALISLLMSIQLTVNQNVYQNQDCFLNSFIDGLDAYYHKSKKDSSADCEYFRNRDENFDCLMNSIVDNTLFLMQQLPSLTASKVISRIRTILIICPQFFNRFFQYGFSIIQLRELEVSTIPAWIVISTLVTHDPSNELIYRNFETIFRLSCDSFETNSLTAIIVNFWYCLFASIQFQTPNPIPFYNDVCFSDLICYFFEKFFNSIRQIPSYRNKLVKMNHDWNEMFARCLISLFSQCDDQAIQTTKSVLSLIINDNSLSHVAYYIQFVFNKFLLYCSMMDKLELKNIVENELSRTQSIEMTIYLITIYFTIIYQYATTNEKLIESYEFLKPFLNSENRKIAKTAWLSFSLFSTEYRSIIIKKMNSKSPFVSDLSEFSISFSSYNVDQSLRVILMPIINECSNQNDPIKLFELLKKLKSMFVLIVEKRYGAAPTSNNDIPELFSHPYFYHSSIISSYISLKDEILDMINKLSEQFASNNQIIIKLLSIYEAYFVSLSLIFQEYNSNMQSRNYRIWRNEIKHQSLLNIPQVFCDVSYLYSKFFSQYYVPLSPKISLAIKHIVHSALSPYVPIKNKAISILHSVATSNPEYFISIIRTDILNQNIKNEDAIGLLSNNGVLSVALRNIPVLCRIMKYVCFGDQNTSDYLSKLDILIIAFYLKKYDYKEENVPFLLDFRDFLSDFLSTNQDNTPGFHRRVLIFIKFLIRAKIPLNNCLYQYILDSSSSYSIDLLTLSLSNLSHAITPTVQHQKVFRNISNFFVDAIPIFNNNIYITFNQTFVEDSAHSSQIDQTPSVEPSSSEPDLDSLTSEELEKYLMGNDDQEDNNALIPTNFSLNWNDSDSLEYLHDPWNGFFWFNGKLSKKILFSQPEVSFSEYIVPLIESLIANYSSSNDINPISSIPGFSTLISSCLTTELITTLSFFVENNCRDTPENGFFVVLFELTEGVLKSPIVNEDALPSFYGSVLFPLLYHSSNNTDSTSAANQFIMNIASSIKPFLLKPLVSLCFEQSPKSHLDSNVSSRAFLSYLGLLLSYNCPYYFSSIELLYESLIQPLFDDFALFTNSHSADLFGIYINLVEATCVPEDSPLYSPKMKGKKAFLLDSLDQALSKFDPVSKEMSRFMPSFFSYLSSGSLRSVMDITPIVFKNAKVILDSANFSNENSEDIIYISMMDYTGHPVFNIVPQFTVDLVTILLNHLKNLSVPLINKMHHLIEKLLVSKASSLKTEHWVQFFDLVYKYASSITNSNLKVTSIQMLGIVLFFLKRKDLEMCPITASAIIASTTIFDRVDDSVIKAFEYLQDIIDSAPLNSVSFIETIVQKFWDVHSNAILPSIEESIIQYRSMFPPHYIT